MTRTTKMRFIAIMVAFMLTAAIGAFVTMDQTNTQKVYADTAVALVGENTYTTLNDAFNAVPADGTVKLLADVTVSGANILKSITLDLNGHTLTIGNGGLNVANSELTVDNSAPATGGVKGEGIGYSGTSKIIFRHCRTSYSYDSFDMMVNYADYKIADGFVLEALAGDPNGFLSIVRPEQEEGFSGDAFYIDKYGYARVRAAGNYTLLTDQTTSLDADTWFVVYGQIETTNTLTLTGNNATCNVILMDGAELTMKSGAHLRISGGNTLNFYKGGTDEYTIEGTGVFKIEVGYTCSVEALAGTVNLNVYGGTFIANNTYEAFTGTVVLTVGNDLTVYAGENEGSAVKVTGDGWKGKPYVRVTKAPTHTHNAITFEEWDSANSLPSVAGNYYLTQDVTVSGTWAVPTGVTNLCLNGHSIQKTDYTRIAVNNGCTLNLYECDDTVKYVSYVSNNYDEITAVSTEAPANGTEWEDYIVVKGGFIATPKAQGVYVDAGGTFNMYGGTICLSSRGVAVSSDTATFNMYGGTICACHDNPGVYTVGTTNIAGGVIEHNDNSMLGGGIYAERGTVTVSGGVIRNNRANGSYASGGGIFMQVPGTLYITGGEISGNEAGRDGGGIQCDGELHLSGGTITGNHASGNGGGMALTEEDYNGLKRNYFSGNLVVKDNTAGEGNAVNNIYTDTYKLVIEAPLTDGAYLSVTMKTPGVFTEGLDGNLPAGKTVDQVLYSDTMSYGVTLEGTEATLVRQHGHDETVFTTAWDSDDSLPDAAGNYYLTQNVVLSGNWTVPEGTVNLCLNGYGIKLTNGKITVGVNSTLNLYDCNESNATYYIVPDANGRVSSIGNVNSEGAYAVSGGFIANAPEWAICVDGGTLNLYGGTICFNRGGVKLTAGNFEMNGGAITHNNTTAYNSLAGMGSGVYVANVIFTMNGGTIAYNEHSSFGSGVYIATNGTFILNDGSINNNQAYAGGGVSNFAGTFIMNGGEIASNVSDELGGGVEIETSFTMNGGTIRQNRSGMGGGIASGGVFTLTGGSITDNQAYYGGGIVIKNGEFHISGAPDIKDNLNTSSNPSNICLWNMDQSNLITIDGALTNTTPYGVHMYTPDTFTVDDVAAYKDNFTSDDSAYVIKTTAENALTLALAHVHSFTYTVDGATITATCTADDCSLPENKATLTLVGPAGSLVYDGAAKSATIESGYNTDAFPSATIVYYKDNAVVDSCVGAGSYVATVTFGDVTAEVPFTVTKATPAYTVPTEINATYGDTLSEVALPSGWTWVEADTTAVGNAGNRDHQALFTPADPANYETATETVTVAVAKATPAYTVPTELSAVFNTTLANIALPTGWAWNAPTTNVGSVAGDFTFKATFTPADTANYNLVENVDVTVNVHEHQHVFEYVANGAVITATCTSDECPYDLFSATLTLSPYENLVYDGTQKWIYTEYAVGTEDIFEPFDVYYYKDNVLTYPINVGTYVARATLHGVTAEISFTITPSSFEGYSLTLSTDTLTYTGEEQSVAATLRKGGDTPIQEDTDYTLSGNKATEVGEYTVTVTGKGNFVGTVTAKYYVVPANIEGLGIDAPENGFDENYIYVVSPWATTYLHYWGNIDGGEYVSWPGAEMESLGNGLFRYQYPTLKNNDTAVYLIFDTNGGSEQTADLKDSKDVALGSVYFVTAKEPGQANAATSFKSRSQQRAAVTMTGNSANVEKVEFSGKTLVENVDYTVSYKTSAGVATTKPTAVGDYIVVVTGTGNYTGSVEKAFTLSHSHSFAYTLSEDGKTIIATCSGDYCTLENGKAELSIVAPDGELIYDGTAKAATITEGYSAEAFPNATVKYYKNNEEVDSCVNVGTYTAKVTFGEATAQVSFTIAKATPDCDIPDDLEATYGDALSDVDLPEGWAWVEADTTAVGNAGERDHQIIFTPDDTDNYETVTETITITVFKAVPDYDLPEGLASLVNKTLAEITLPEGWTWANATTNVGSEEGEKTFKATFTPEDTDNYEIVENIDVTVNVYEHVHDFAYTASGATITAVCGNEGCFVNAGLTLTLNAPAGELIYDGTAKAATITEGYSAEAFPNATVKYYKNNEEVDSCVNVGTYTAKVTFGEATAQVTFTIESWTFVEEDKGVTVEIEGAEYDDDIVVEVEVRTDVASEQSQVDYSEIVKDNLASNEEIAIVYDVKLIQITVVGGVETKTAIQPSDIKPGTTVLIRMDIPEALRGKTFRLLHIHSANDVEFIENFTVSADGTYLTVRVNRLSDFAFVIAKGSGEGEAEAHGFCIGWIALILACIVLVYFLVWLLLGRKKLLQSVGVIVSAAELVFAVVAIIVHTCIVSVIALILAIIAAVLFALFLFLFKDKGEGDEEVLKETASADEDDEEETETEDETDEAEFDEEAGFEDEAVDGVGLKESLAVAASAIGGEKLTKAYIADYLGKNYPNSVEINRRDNYTKTGLPLADTHYVTADGKRTCFVYAYETEGATMLLLKTKDELGEEFKKEHSAVRRSAFPKSKDSWYAVVLDDSFTVGQVEDMIDRTIAVCAGKKLAKPIKGKSPVRAIKKVTVAEAGAMISDEVAAAAITTSEDGKRHIGKKDIVNVDTLSENFNDGDVVTIQALKDKNLVPRKSKQVKLLARGELNKVLHVELQDYSLEAVKMVIATGGTVKIV